MDTLLTLKTLKDHTIMRFYSSTGYLQPKSHRNTKHFDLLSTSRTLIIFFLRPKKLQSTDSSTFQGHQSQIACVTTIVNTYSRRNSLGWCISMLLAGVLKVTCLRPPNQLSAYRSVNQHSSQTVQHPFEIYDN